MHPEQTGPGFTSTYPALRRSSRRYRAVLTAPVVEKGGCAPPIAQAVCVGPDSRICVRRLHLLAGHHVKVPDRCLRTRLSPPGTHFTAESTEAMRIKSLAQGENILMLGFDSSTSVSKIDILTTRPICSERELSISIAHLLPSLLVMLKFPSKSL